MKKTLVLILFTLLFCCSHKKDNSLDKLIFSYDKTRDSKELTRHFNKDIYWLTLSSFFDINSYLKQKNSSRFFTKVLRKKAKFVGFISYEILDKEQGKLALILVAKEFRSQGFGDKLMNYMINDFKNKGIKKIKLITRSNNIVAQRFFKKFGFKNTFQDLTHIKMATAI